VTVLLVILRVLDLDIQVPVVYANIIISDAYLVALVIFYSITSIRILKMIAKSQNFSQRKKRTKRSACILLAGCFGIVLIILWQSTSFLFYQSPVGDVLVLWFRSFLLSYASFCLLLFFGVSSATASVTVSGEGKDTGMSYSQGESGNFKAVPKPADEVEKKEDKAAECPKEDLPDDNLSTENGISPNCEKRNGNQDKILQNYILPAL
jgi:hypothetical protein